MPNQMPGRDALLGFAQEWRRVASSPLLPGLQLADGAVWALEPGNARAAEMTAQLAEVMRLSPQPAPERRIRLWLDERRRAPRLAQSDEERLLNCVMGRATTRDDLATQMTFLALLIAQDAQNRGAVLIHGALAERDGQGVILAAPGGTGKSTASRRFPPPWRSLSDDATLVVRDTQGRCWAHPWPTWSRFFPGGAGGSWEVWEAIPLRAFFFLVQAPHERLERVGAGQAACLLSESSEQVSQLMALDKSEEGMRRLRRQRFENACELARLIPCHILELSLHGKFWENIESVL